METRELPVVAPRRVVAPADRRPKRPGWVRCQVMGRPAQLWTGARPDTDPTLAATPRPEDTSMLKKARNRASAILSGSAVLYREMALSALRLVRR
jgi:hypothetical protein